MSDAMSNEPVLRRGHPKIDKLGKQFVDQTGKLQEKAVSKSPKSDKQDKQPPGGFDATPIPRAPPGYTLKFTFNRANNLPLADLIALSSDPYVSATLKTDLQKRHKQDPDLQIRTPTVHKNTNPVWNCEWTVANVPASGFFLKCRLYDEDPADHDDRLGNAHIYVDKIDDNWKGFQERSFNIKKHMGSKRAYLFRGCAAMLSRNVKMNGEMIVSIENLGRTKGNDGGRAYTIGPLHWSRHYSPLIGRLTGTKDSEEVKDGKKVDKYNFQAVQMQLAGPVPAPLYHRYVEFKPFVAGMFTSHSLRGRVLNHALHHQHARIYNYDRTTVYGTFPKPGEDMTANFLELLKYDQGGRIFTYVLTLDALWRFTETGKEFGIDMLSKHTMHSDVSEYIAFSGEFFIRRLKRPHQDNSESADAEPDSLPPTPDSDHLTQDEKASSAEPTKDPSMYELVIDNDSGTYRPNAKYLHALKEFMAQNLPGLRVMTLDCQADAEKMKKLKDEQRERKKASGKQMTYQQNKSMSSISSSGEETLQKRGESKKPQQGRLDKIQHAIGISGNDTEGEKSANVDDETAEGSSNVEHHQVGPTVTTTTTTTTKIHSG